MPYIEPEYRVSPMSFPARYLAANLTEPLPTTDRGVLRTIGEAVAYMTALPKHREIKTAWQHACRLILRRAPGRAKNYDAVRLGRPTAEPRKQGLRTRRFGPDLRFSSPAPGPLREFLSEVWKFPNRFSTLWRRGVPAASGHHMPLAQRSI